VNSWSAKKVASYIGIRASLLAQLSRSNAITRNRRDEMRHDPVPYLDAVRQSHAEHQNRQFATAVTYARSPLASTLSISLHLHMLDRLRNRYWTSAYPADARFCFPKLEGVDDGIPAPFSSRVSMTNDRSRRLRTDLVLAGITTFLH
jgi:hypothetical protein